MAETMTAVDRPNSAALMIVLVEDGESLAASIAKTLKSEGFEVHIASDGERGLELARTLPAELVVIDVSLPSMDGIETCRRLRRFSDAYVIILTAHSAESDRLAGLSVGADDYMTKPFYPRELVARIRAMQRRPRSSAAGTHLRCFGELEIDPDTQSVRVDGRSVELSATEFRLLDALSAQPQRTLSRAELIRVVWGDGWVGDAHIIDVNLSNLRRKLGEQTGDRTYIATVRGFGYRMEETEDY
jgi:DNA-binding response OmpR family regulator